MEKTKKLKNFDKKKQVRRKGEKGITLIALIITIIVLLILAGISIATLTGENGILTKANQAKEETEKASKKEKTDLAILEEMMNGTGTEVQQVIDEKPGELEKNETDDNIFIINSIEDLVFFAYDVTKGNTYEEQTVELGTSLDFNSVKSYVDAFRTDYGQYGYDGELKTLLTSGEGFKPIGVGTNENGYENGSFKGTFDGNEKIINNLYMNKDEENYALGFFGNNYGEIKNLGLENCNIYGKEGTPRNDVLLIIGGFCGRNYGNIDGCYVTGKIEGYIQGDGKLRIGGISGIAEKGNICNCYNVASISATGIGNFQLGGVVGLKYSSSGKCNVSKCYNRGGITFENKSSNEAQNVGGIMGNLSGSGTIANCYNLGDVKGTSGNGGNAGGVLGVAGDGATLDNCHCVCVVEYSNEHWGSFVGYVRNEGNADAKICNCSFFSNDTSPKPFFQNDVEETKEGVEAINDIKGMKDILLVLGDAFKMKNNGYPILKWQTGD